MLVLEEFIQGDTLDFLLKAAPLSPTATREIIIQLCQALRVLHSFGAVHRDIKPENVILREREAVLIDFDAARLHKPALENNTVVLGTTGFAAPEQYGLSQSDARADIYSLGVLMNVMLTGEHPSTPEDAPMNTTEELQALLEELGRTAESDAEINIHLPPVAYEGELVLNRRAVNLCGSLDQTGARTTFTGPVYLAYSSGAVSSFEGIDFTGSGGGTGVFASFRLHLTNCRLSRWDTAVFCSKTAWVNTDQCTFLDNGVGLHINNAESNISDSRFEGNTFQGNQTAVLLEQIGVKTPLKFPGTLFSGNGTDIDNRCGQELDLDRTVFQ